MRSIVFAFLASVLLAGPPAISAGCGGCYVDEAVVDLATTPAESCLQLSATDVSPCTGGYLVTVVNDCTDALVIPSANIAAGATMELDSYAYCGGNTTCSIAGMLGAGDLQIAFERVGGVEIGGMKRPHEHAKAQRLA